MQLYLRKTNKNKEKRPHHTGHSIPGFRPFIARIAAVDATAAAVKAKGSAKNSGIRVSKRVTDT